ncbi:MAG: GNAT family N-acetyltransferase [Acidimicrobiales bacterium]|jgi:GNAT superfamily N-acetyltransferase
MAQSTITLTVRPAEVADAGDIAASHVRSWQVGYAGVIPDAFLRGLDKDLAKRTLHIQTEILGAEAENRFVLVGEVEGEIVGWLGGGPYRTPAPGGAALGEVYACYVDPVYWCQGVGGALMAAALERLTGAAYREAVLWVLADNPRARTFYEHHGWAADGTSKTYEVAGQRLPEVRYRRALP